MPLNPPEHLGPLTLSEQERLDLKTISRYGFDRSGHHEDNHIVEEVRILKQPDGSIIRSFPLQEGLFYSESVKVYDWTDPSNPRELRKAERDPGTMELIKDNDPEYYCSEISTVVGSLTGLEACLLVVILDGRQPEEVMIDYQCVGGQFSNPSALMRRMVDNIGDSEICYDSIFNKPAVFNPKHHMHSLTDVVGMEFLVDAINNVARTLELSYVPAFIHFRDKVCKMIRDGLRPPPSLSNVRDEIWELFPTTYTGPRPQEELDPWPSDKYVSKSDVLMMLAEYEANGFASMGSKSIKFVRAVNAASNSLDLTFEFLHPAVHTGVSWGCSVEVVFAQPDGSERYVNGGVFGKAALANVTQFVVNISKTPTLDPLTSTTPPQGDMVEVSIYTTTEAELLVNTRVSMENH